MLYFNVSSVLVTVKINLLKSLVIMIYLYFISVPEELEIDGSESQDSGINSSSMKEAPPTRKAYSSPVQRTTELDQCTVMKKLQSTSDQKLLRAQPSHITENNSGIKEDAVKSVIEVQSKTNEEKAKNGVNTVKVAEKNPNVRNIVNNELLEDQKTQQKMQDESFQKDSSHSVRDKKETFLESIQNNSVKTKTPLQQGPHLATRKENTLGTMKVPRSKNKNSYLPDQSKRNESTAEKEHCLHDEQLEDNVFGPELDITTLKNNVKFNDKSENNLQGQKEKSANLNAKECAISSSLKKYPKQISKNGIITKQSLLMGNPALDDNWVSVSQNEMIVKNGTESKFSDMKIAQNPSSKDNFSTVDSTTEMKTKQSFQQMKQVNETAYKCINVREKSMVTDTEEKNNFVQSILTVLNSLAGKGEIIYNLFTGYMYFICTGQETTFSVP
jgi:hypothetical protein